jgi:hypothetical protein
MMRMIRTNASCTSAVMAGLVPAIHALTPGREDVDARDVCAKTRFALLPGHDDANRFPP